MILKHNIIGSFNVDVLHIMDAVRTPFFKYPYEHIRNYLGHDLFSCLHQGVNNLLKRGEP